MILLSCEPLYLKAQNSFTAGFYNLENLFDTIDNPHKDDDDFTPKGRYQWNTERYNTKIEKIAHVLSAIETTTKMPLAIVGFCEVENAEILQTLTQSPTLRHYQYGTIIYPSTDNRGLGTALLYRANIYHPYFDTIYKVTDPTSPDFATRDQLLVSGTVDSDTLHCIVIHYPSRRSGRVASEPKRILAAKVTHTIVEQIQQKYRNPKIVIFGDFNDTPTDKSITTSLKADTELTNKTQLWNSSYTLAKKGYGTLVFQSSWYLFDQIIISKPLINSQKGYHYISTHIFAPDKITTTGGKFIGVPLRTFEGQKYTGGYSDHFPVYLVLSR